MKASTGALLTCLWLQLNWALGEQVEQHPSTLRVQEGDSSVINCTYSDSASSYFPWYKQEAGKGPQLIIDIRSNVGRNQKQRLLVLMDKAARHVSLHITAARPADSAVYFCAAGAHCCVGTCRLCENLALRWAQPCPLAQAFQYLPCWFVSDNYHRDIKKHIV